MTHFTIVDCGITWHLPVGYTSAPPSPSPRRDNPRRQCPLPKLKTRSTLRVSAHQIVPTYYQILHRDLNPQIECPFIVNTAQQPPAKYVLPEKRTALNMSSRKKPID